MLKIIISIFFMSALLFGSCQITPAQESAGSAFAKNTQNKILFLSPNEAIQKSKETKKPILAIIASSNCSAWAELKKELNNDKDLKNVVTKNFILTGVNGYELEYFPHLATDISPTIYLLNEDFVQVAPEIKGVPNNTKAFADWLQKFSNWYKTSK